MHYLALLFTGVPSSRYNLLSYLRVGVALRASVQGSFENEALENDRPKHEAPKSRKRSTYRKRSTQKLENEDPLKPVCPL